MFFYTTMFNCAVICVGMFFSEALFGVGEIADGVTLRTLSIFPFFFGMMLYILFPPDGSGVGKEATALDGLQLIKSAKDAKATKDGDSAAKEAEALPLGKDGALLEGHAYVLLVFNCSPGSLSAMNLKAEKFQRHVSRYSDWLHMLCVSYELPEKLAPIANKWKSCHIYQDSKFKVSSDYVIKYGAYVSPHVFVIDVDHKIKWQQLTEVLIV